MIFKRHSPDLPDAEALLPEIAHAIVLHGCTVITVSGTDYTPPLRLHYRVAADVWACGDHLPGNAIGRNRGIDRQDR